MKRENTNIYKEGSLKKDNMKEVQCPLCKKLKTVDNRNQKFECCRVLHKIDEKTLVRGNANKSRGRKKGGHNKPKNMIFEGNYTDAQKEKIKAENPTAIIQEPEEFVVKKAKKEEVALEKPENAVEEGYKYRCGLCRSPFNEMITGMDTWGNRTFNCPVCKGELSYGG